MKTFHDGKGTEKDKYKEQHFKNKLKMKNRIFKNMTHTRKQGNEETYV